MKIAKSIFLMLAVAPLFACAPMIWEKPGASQRQFDEDTYACERDMRQSGYFGVGLGGELNRRKFYKQCMRSKGYGLRE